MRMYKVTGIVNSDGSVDKDLFQLNDSNLMPYIATGIAKTYKCRVSIDVRNNIYTYHGLGDNFSKIECLMAAKELSDKEEDWILLNMSPSLINRADNIMTGEDRDYYIAIFIKKKDFNEYLSHLIIEEFNPEVEMKELKVQTKKQYIEKTKLNYQFGSYMPDTDKIENWFEGIVENIENWFNRSEFKKRIK